MGYRAVEVSLARKKSGLFGIGTLAGDLAMVKRRRNQSRNNSSVRAAENLVILVERRSVLSDCFNCFNAFRPSSVSPLLPTSIGFWKSGMALPLPSGACPRPRLIRMELWCN